MVNQALYDRAEIPRIDTFLIGMTSNNFSKLPAIDNVLLRAIASQDDAVASRELASGYVSPQCFMYCDSRGMLQEATNIPWIYHWRRNKADKRIALDPDASIYDTSKFKYSFKLPQKDSYDFHRLNFERYWWLTAISKHIPELLARRQSLVYPT